MTATDDEGGRGGALLYLSQGVTASKNPSRYRRRWGTAADKRLGKMTVFRDCICILLLYYRYESEEWPACGIYRTVNRNSPWENRLTMSGALSSVDVHADSPGPTRTQCACSFCHCSPPLDILQLPQLCGISKENKRTYLPHMES